MTQKSSFRKQKSWRGRRGQAIVEFSIALPVLLMLLVVIMEVGRMIFMYAMVVNSSRDAVRYASAYGRGEDLGAGNLYKYAYCDGIRETAKQSGFMLNLQDADIDIEYDGGPGVAFTSPYNVCDAATGEDSNILNYVDSGDRVSVTVRVDYEPVLSILPIGGRTFSATSSRTILGIYKLG